MEKIKINFTDFWASANNNVEHNPIYRMLAKHFVLEISDNPDFLVYSCFGEDFLNYDCIRIFYTAESIRPKFYECDYAFSFDYPINARSYRLPHYRICAGEFNRLTSEKNVEEILKQKKKFCSFLYSNQHAKTRNQFFYKLAKYKDIDSGGAFLNNIGYQIARKKGASGLIEMVEFMQNYKFNIAFENSLYPGYTTNKILNPMVANSIPIYWGNPFIAQEFNPKSFINCHDYKNLDEVIERIIEIDNDDELYKQYLSEPYFVNNEVPQFLQEERIMARFEAIFKNRQKLPVAKTWQRYHSEMMRKNINWLQENAKFFPGWRFRFKFSDFKEHLGMTRHYYYNMFNQHTKMM